MPNSFFNSVKEFVEASGGNHVIRSVLVANNGIGAVKAIRSIRRWAFDTFGDEKIVFINIYTLQSMLISLRTDSIRSDGNPRRYESKCRVY